MKQQLLFLALFLGAFMSCHTNNGQASGSASVASSSKLAQLQALSQDAIMDKCDLSNSELSSFPDLSSYTIKSLDLSSNELDTIIVSYLPKGLESLNLSSNKIKNIPDMSSLGIRHLDLSHNAIASMSVDCIPKELYSLDLSYNLLKGKYSLLIDGERKLSSKERRILYSMYKIREINISHNDLTYMEIAFPIRKILASHNNLDNLDFNYANIEYLDISNNARLLNDVLLAPKRIDTLIHNNIANDKEMVSLHTRGIIY